VIHTTKIHDICYISGQRREISIDDVMKRAREIIESTIIKRKIQWVVDASLLVECEGSATHISQTRQSSGSETLGTS